MLLKKSSIDHRTSPYLNETKQTEAKNPISSNNGNRSSSLSNAKKLSIVTGPNISITSNEGNGARVSSAGGGQPNVSVLSAVSNRTSNPPSLQLKELQSTGAGAGAGAKANQNQNCLETFIKKMNSLNISTATADQLNQNPSKNLGLLNNLASGDNLQIDRGTQNSRPYPNNGSNPMNSFNSKPKPTPNDWW